MLYTAGLSPPRDTYTPLEIDILPNHIMNRRRLKPRALHQDFVELLRQPLDPDEKLVPAVAELWEDERRRRAQRNLSLSEMAMMPAGGGMGGRNMEELGYKVEGKEYGKNIGGDWKISQELWAMLESRMEVERARKGRLTFERFAADAQAGKGGEKRKYDRVSSRATRVRADTDRLQWIMTTFEALSAHWPRLGAPKSSARSKRSRRSKASSVMAPSSPLARHGGASLPGAGALAHSSPGRSSPPLFEIKAELVDAENAIPNGQVMNSNGDDDIDSSEEEEEDNPFDAYAMSSQAMEIKVEVNPHMIARPVEAMDEDDEEEAFRALHAADARQHAEEAVRIRATQAPTKGDSSGDEGDFDDDELDQIFRDTVLGGYGSGPSTPHSRRGNGTATPTTRGSATSVSGGGIGSEARRGQRERMMRERAGLGDLSTIFDRSSVSLTPTPRPNPYDDRVTTPGRPHTPRSSEKVTPTSLVKNLFARNRVASPSETPTKRAAWPPVNTVILPPTKRSVVGWGTPSPEEAEDSTDSKPLEAVKTEHPASETEATDIKPSITEELVFPASDETRMLPPAGQKIPSNDQTNTTSGNESSGDQVLKRGPSPTYIDPQPVPPPVAQEEAPEVEQLPIQTSQDRPRKRVRMAEPFDEPENPFSMRSPANSSPIQRPSQASQRSQRSQLSQSSAHSKMSLLSSQSAPTSETTSINAPPVSDKAWAFHLRPPSVKEVMDTMESSGLDTVIYQEPFYSTPSDVPPRPKMFAGRMFNLKGNSTAELPEFEDSFGSLSRSSQVIRGRRAGPVKGAFGWEYGRPPPSVKHVEAWRKREDLELAEKGK